MERGELVEFLTSDPETTGEIVGLLMPAIVSVLRDRESDLGEALRRAILDMLAEEVEIEVSCGTSDDSYSDSFGDPSSVSVSLEFGQHNMTEQESHTRRGGRIRYNLNTVNGEGYF